MEPTNSPITGDREVEKLAKSITRAIHRAATASIPRKTRTRARGVVWWTPLLSDLKRMVNAARKSYQHARCSNAENIESSLSDYRRIRRIYTNTIHATKRESWNQFVTDQALTSTWGLAYKLLVSKISPAEVLSSISTADAQFTKTWEDTASSLCNSLFPKDLELNETPQQAAIRADMTTLPDTAPDPHYITDADQVHTRPRPNRSNDGEKRLPPSA